MKMHSKVVVSLFCFSAVSAAHAAEFYDYGRVRDVRPQTEQFNQPRQECTTEQVVEPQQRNVGGAILGGLVGGILGNQVGRGNGRTAATAAGAVTGAVVGDRMDNDQNGTTERQVRNCRMVDHWETRTSGYTVTYEYLGHSYTSVMPNDPGDRIKLHVSIMPLP